MSFQVEGDMYRLGTSTGRLDRLYSRNQLDVCRDRHLTADQVPDLETAIREAARHASGGKGQGFLKCLCVRACTGRCKCVKNGVKCTSRCHHSRTCNNSD